MYAQVTPSEVLVAVGLAGVTIDPTTMDIIEAKLKSVARPPEGAEAAAKAAAAVAESRQNFSNGSSHASNSPGGPLGAARSASLSPRASEMPGVYGEL